MPDSLEYQRGKTKTLILPVVLVMAAALAIRLYRLDGPSLWLDEAYSFWFSSQGWSYLWTEVPKFETHPSLYYSLLKLWRTFGDDEFTLRLLSVLINVATIPFVALAAWHCGSRDNRQAVAILAAILFACSPTQVQAAQDVRAYALMTLGLAVALASALAVMTGGERASVPLRHILARDRPMALAFLGIGAGIALLAWGHNYGAVYGLLLGLCLFGFWLAQGAPRGLLLNLLVSAGLALLLYAPNIPIVLMQTRSLSNNGFWVQVPGLRVLTWTLLEMPIGYSDLGRPRILAGGVASLLLALAGWAAMAWPKRRLPLAVPVTLIILAIAPVALSFVISHLGKPIFLFRALQPSQLPMLLGLAFAPFAIAGLLPGRLRWITLALPLSLGVLALWHTQPGRPRWLGEDWRGLARAIAAATAPATPKLLIYPAESELPFLYYASRLDIPLEIETIPGPYPARRADYTYPAGNGGSPGMTPQMMTEAIGKLKGDDRIWIVTRTLDVYDPAGLLMTGLGREFPCLIDDSLPRIELRSRADASGACPDR